MSPTEPKKIRRRTNDKDVALLAQEKDVALLAQEMGFFNERFDEFKVQTTRDFAEVKSNTSGYYESKARGDDHERRISRLEKAALWVLVTTFSVVFIAVIGLVVVKQQ